MKETELKKVLGPRMKLQRKRMGTTNIALSEKLGVHKATVSNWLSGHRVPEMLTLIKIAEELNTSVDYLIGKTDNHLPKSNSIDLRKVFEYKNLEFDGQMLTDDERETINQVFGAIINMGRKNQTPKILEGRE
ncbi:helix-turn-helix domain-containing protein [Priestia aryabhattai]